MPMPRTPQHTLRRALCALSLGAAIALPAPAQATPSAQSAPPAQSAPSPEALVPTPPPELVSVPALDLNRYQGRWYQIAYYPNRFQRQCVQNTQALYEPLQGGQVRVTNRCTQADGSVAEAVGLARPQRGGLWGWGQGPAQAARLEVRFAPAWLSWLPPVWGSYWVIQLADDYRYAVIGEPSRNYLWILSRTPTLAPADRATILARLPAQGYDPARLREEPQTAGKP